LEPYLAEDRRPTFPQVPILCPPAHQQRHRPRLVAQHASEVMCRERIDDIPPGTRDNHLLVQRYRRHRLTICMATLIGQRDGRVSLLTVLGAAPDLERDGAQLVAVEAISREHVAPHA